MEVSLVAKLIVKLKTKSKRRRNRNELPDVELCKQFPLKSMISRDLT